MLILDPNPDPDHDPNHDPDADPGHDYGHDPDTYPDLDLDLDPDLRLYIQTLTLTLILLNSSNNHDGCTGVYATITRNLSITCIQHTSPYHSNHIIKLFHSLNDARHFLYT